MFDEAQILTEQAISDMVPATNTSPNALVLYIGTPPRPADPGEAFTERRRQALAGEDDMLYVEFSADRDADSDDRAQWRKANPSFPRRTSETSMLRMQRQLGKDSFRREALGIWDETATNRAINPEQWTKAATDTPNIKGLIGYALDMKPDRSSLAIGGASTTGTAPRTSNCAASSPPNPKAPNGRSTTSPTTGRAQQAWPSTRNHPP